MVKSIKTTAFNLAQKFSGIKELNGDKDNNAIMAMLKLDDDWPDHDEVPWCSAFVKYICFLLGLPRSYKLLARDWLLVGKRIGLADAEIGFDIVILNRGGSISSHNFTDPGHVGFFAGLDDDHVWILGGNQNDSVCVMPFDIKDILGIRRLI